MADDGTCWRCGHQLGANATACWWCEWYLRSLNPAMARVFHGDGVTEFGTAWADHLSSGRSTLLPDCEARPLGRRIALEMFWERIWRMLTRRDP